MYVIGIVGAPAGGKSTVARRLQELGAYWIDADQIARQVLQRDDVQKQLIRHFGADITGNDGRIDRAKLARRVFGDDEKSRAALKYLEEVIHPPTRQIIMDQLQRAGQERFPVAVLDVPLLLESGWDRMCDAVWCVDTDRAQRVQRARSRGWDDEELARREAHQWPIEVKRRLSSVVIGNDADQEALRAKIDGLWEDLLEQIQNQPTDPTQNHCQEDGTKS